MDAPGRRSLVSSYYTRHGWLESSTSVEGPASSKIYIDPRLEARGLREDTPLLVMIQVNPGHVPEGVSVRKQISARILTAQVTPSALKRLEEDPDVISVSSQLLRVG
jgi:hypothetical protein